MAAAATEIERYWSNYQDEVDGAALYRALGALEMDPRISAVYDRLAAAEDGHAEFWASRLTSAGESPPTERTPSWRTRCVISLARWFGPAIVLPSVAAMERAASTKYDNQPDSPGEMAASERSHARVVGALGELAGDRRGGAASNPIPAVLIGVNDGLVLNLALMSGLTGAGLPSGSVALAGLIGRVAGAGSKGTAAWLKIRSARELFERQIETQASELAAAPAAEREELALIYQVRGYSEAQARELAEQVMRDGATALGTLAREEARIDPEDLTASPLMAVANAVLLFASGAIVPLLGFIFVTGAAALWVAGILSAAALFGIGVALTVFTGSNAVYSGARQVGIGAAVALGAYAVGVLLGP